MRQKIHVWHLEITSPPTHDFSIPRTYRLEQLTLLQPALARYLYVAVGAPWCWYMRLGWRYQDWQKRLEDPSVQIWIAYAEGAPIGYFELESQPNGSTEICYFGLIPEAIGQGHGKLLLEDAIQTAWQLGGKRVWLHTCTLDHPNALENYQRRGFTVFKEEDVVDNIPDEPIQPWTGAAKS